MVLVRRANYLLNKFTTVIKTTQPFATMVGQARRRDPNTLSNYDEIRTSKVAINYDINFEKKVLTGNVVLSMKVVAEDGCKQIVLDTRLDHSSSNKIAR